VRIVLDTNVIVSALLSELGAPARVLELCVAGDVDLVIDSRILSEYREVLLRPEFAFDPADVTAILDLMQYAEYVVSLPLNLPLPDPDDLTFVEVAAAAGADAIVTGNAKHFRALKGKVDIEVLTSRELLTRLSGGG
jgi:putative PIN family toxin of toxin-antitoxin system